MGICLFDTGIFDKGIFDHCLDADVTVQQGGGGVGIGVGQRKSKRDDREDERLRARRQRQIDELSRLPSKEEIQAERERLGILPKKAQKAVQKIAERELSGAAADDDSLEAAIKEFFSGALQERAERAVRNELAAKGQPYRPEVPSVLRAILADGLRRAAESELRQQHALSAAAQEEAEVNEILAVWLEM